MIRARCLHRSGYRFISRSVDFASSSPPNYKLFSAFAGATLKHEPARFPPTRTSRQLQLRRSPLQILNRSFAPRFASTTPIPQPIANIQSDYVPPSPTSTPAENFFPSPLDEATTSISPPVYDHLGFLKELGLDYGWGPTAMVETLLEHVHVYLGTPWWASIGISILIIRAALFKFYLNAADSSARRQAIKHLDEPINARYKVAIAEKDRMALLNIRTERSALYISAGIKWWISLLPLLQIPIGFGTFRLMRGMAALPVPGFESGGLLWISDLTIPDPYFVLPAATACAYYYAFKKGGETGNSALVSKTAQRFFLYVFPIIGGAFMLWWPAGLQLTFFVTSFITTMQAILFSNKWFRSLAGIQPIPEGIAPISQSSTNPRYQASASTSTPKTSAGILGNVKVAVSDIMKAGDKYSPMSKAENKKGRLTDAEKRHAKAYEEKRQKELAKEAGMKRQAAQARFEREQEKVTREQERKEGLQRRAEKKAKRRQ